MSPEELYRQIRFRHQLTDDDKQELAIKLWEKREQYNPEIATLSAWVTAAAINYSIDKKRKEKNDLNSLTIPLSHFDGINEDGREINNTAIDFLSSYELSPEEQLIASENGEALLEAIKKLSSDHIEVICEYLDGTYDGTCPTNRSKFHRAKKQLLKILLEKKNEYVYKIEGKNGEVIFANNKLEAAKKVGVTDVTIAYALKNSGFFKKKYWKIIEL